MSDDKCKQCPECNHTKFINVDELGDGFRNCANCGQEWWTNVDYTDATWFSIDVAPVDGTRVLVTDGKRRQIEFKDLKNNMFSGWQTGSNHSSINPTHFTMLPSIERLYL